MIFAGAVWLSAIGAGAFAYVIADSFPAGR